MFRNSKTIEAMGEKRSIAARASQKSAAMDEVAAKKAAKALASRRRRDAARKAAKAEAEAEKPRKARKK
jgi:hypothetical protein